MTQRYKPSAATQERRKQTGYINHQRRAREATVQSAVQTRPRFSSATILRPFSAASRALRLSYYFLFLPLAPSLSLLTKLMDLNNLNDIFPGCQRERRRLDDVATMLDVNQRKFALIKIVGGSIIKINQNRRVLLYTSQVIPSTNKIDYQALMRL